MSDMRQFKLWVLHSYFIVKHVDYAGWSEIAEAWSNQVTEYWKQVIALTLGNYIKAQNWLKIARIIGRNYINK